MLAQILALDELTDMIDRKGRSPLSFLGNNQLMYMKDGDFNVYMAAISALVFELRVGFDASFILVDGIDFFDPDREVEIQELIRGLSKVVKACRKQERQGQGCIGGPLKVLFTASTQSHCFVSSTKSSVVLEMPEHIEGQ
jgi:hypothetical protein